MLASDALLEAAGATEGRAGAAVGVGRVAGAAVAGCVGRVGTCALGAGVGRRSGAAPRAQPHARHVVAEPGFSSVHDRQLHSVSEPEGRRETNIRVSAAAPVRSAQQIAAAAACWLVVVLV